MSISEHGFAHLQGETFSWSTKAILDKCLLTPPVTPIGHSYGTISLISNYTV